MPTVILTNSTFSNSFPARRGDFLIYSTCEVLSASLLHCLQSRIFHPNWDFVSAARWLALSSGSKTHLGVLWTEEKGTVNGGVDYGTISLSSPPLHITQIIHTHTHTGYVVLLVSWINPDFHSVSWELANPRRTPQYCSAGGFASIYICLPVDILVQYKTRLKLGKVRFCCTQRGNHKKTNDHNRK